MAQLGEGCVYEPEPVLAQPAAQVEGEVPRRGIRRVEPAGGSERLGAEQHAGATQTRDVAKRQGHAVIAAVGSRPAAECRPDEAPDGCYAAAVRDRLVAVQ